MHCLLCSALGLRVCLLSHARTHTHTTPHTHTHTCAETPAHSSIGSCVGHCRPIALGVSRVRHGRQVAPEFRDYSLEEFSWARMMVASRNFGITIGETKTDALVPLADMLNHYRPRETKYGLLSRCLYESTYASWCAAHRCRPCGLCRSYCIFRASLFPVVESLVCVCTE
jgi:hypothetical protein